MPVLDALFKCFPLRRTVISLHSFYKDDESSPDLSKDDFQNLLNTTSKEWILISNNKCYNHIDGVTIGSPLASVLANTLCVVSKINGSKIVLAVNSWYSVDDISMTYWEAYIGNHTFYYSKFSQSLRNV